MRTTSSTVYHTHWSGADNPRIERAHHVPDLAAEADHLLSLAQPLAIRAFDDLAIDLIAPRGVTSRTM